MKSKPIKINPRREETLEGHVSYVGRLFECALPHKTIRTRMITLLNATANGAAAVETTVFLRDEAAINPPELAQPIRCKCIVKSTGKNGRSVVRDCFEYSKGSLKAVSLGDIAEFGSTMKRAGLLFKC